jgi:hypothetical protein
VLICARAPFAFCDDQGVVIAFGYKRIELTDDADLRTLLNLGQLGAAGSESEEAAESLRTALQRGYAGEVQELSLSDGEARTLNVRLLQHAALGGQVLSPALMQLRNGLEAYVAELTYRDEAGR